MFPFQSSVMLWAFGALLAVGSLYVLDLKGDIADSEDLVAKLRLEATICIDRRAGDVAAIDALEASGREWQAYAAEMERVAEARGTREKRRTVVAKAVAEGALPAVYEAPPVEVGQELPVLIDILDAAIIEAAAAARSVGAGQRPQFTAD